MTTKLNKFMLKHLGQLVGKTVAPHAGKIEDSIEPIERPVDTIFSD